MSRAPLFRLFFAACAAIGLSALGCGGMEDEGETELETGQQAEGLYTSGGSTWCGGSGDVNGNGSITVTDLVLAQRFASNLQTPTACESWRADVNSE